MTNVVVRPSIGSFPWHPIVFGAVIVATAWLDAAVSPYAVARSLLVVVLLAAVLTVVAGLALRSASLGGLVASGIIGILWSKQLLDVAASLIGRMGVAVAIVWAVLVVAAGVVAVRLLGRIVPQLGREVMTRFLNSAAVLLLVATVVLGILNGRLTDAIGDLQQGIGLSRMSQLSADLAAGGVPDIYAILLDGYPRADVLEFAFGFDNAAFLQSLESRGFDVADESHSDYLWTHVSVPAALNMAYVEDIPAMREVIEGRRPRQPTLRRVVANNAAFDTVEEHGYATVAIGAGFEEVAPRQADVYVDGGQLNEFEISLLASTFAGDIVSVLAPDFASSQQRERILFNLEVLPRIARMPDRPPAFVFAHVPAPHQPVVFGIDGAPVAVPITESWFADSPLERGDDVDEFRARYRAQLPFLNERILAAIDGILARSAEPPIIVLFADHGSASAVDWNVTDPAEADPARVLERTGILFAALTPSRGGVFPEDVSPTNMFRHLFDSYLGTNLGPLAVPEEGGHVRAVDAAVLELGASP